MIDLNLPSRRICTKSFYQLNVQLFCASLSGGMDAPLSGGARYLYFGLSPHSIIHIPPLFLYTNSKDPPETAYMYVYWYI